MGMNIEAETAEPREKMKKKQYSEFQFHPSDVFQSYVASHHGSSRINPVRASSGYPSQGRSRKGYHHLPPPQSTRHPSSSSTKPPRQNMPKSRTMNYGARRIFHLRLEFLRDAVRRREACYQYLSEKTGLQETELPLFIGHFFKPYEEQDRVPAGSKRHRSEYRMIRDIERSSRFKKYIPRKWKVNERDMLLHEWGDKGVWTGWDLVTYLANNYKAVITVREDLESAFQVVKERPSYNDIKNEKGNEKDMLGHQWKKSVWTGWDFHGTGKNAQQRLQ